MTGLKKNTEYNFRVVANNKHGPGVSTEDIAVRTLSDGLLVLIETFTLPVLKNVQKERHLLSFLHSAQRSPSEPHAGGPELEGKTLDFSSNSLET